MTRAVRAVVVFALGLAGCSEVSIASDAGVPVDAAREVDSASVDASAALDAPMPSDDGGADAGSTARVRGRVTLFAGDTTLALAELYGADGHYDSARMLGCSLRDLPAGCVITTCVAEPARANVHAGDLTLAVSGGASTTTSPSADGSYAVMPPAWSAGAEVRVDFAGGDVAAFGATVTFPTVHATGAATLGSEGDLHVTWPPLASSVSVWLVQSPGSSTRVQCPFDGAAGAGTIPREALDTLDAEDTADLVILSADAETVSIDDARIDVIAVLRSPSPTARVTLR